MNTASLQERLSTGALDKEFITAIENFYGNYEWRAVHALLEHPEFNSSATWIANKLSISIEDAVSALEGLSLLGLVGKTNDGKYFAQEVQFLIPEEKVSKPEMISNHSLISHQIINRFNQESAAFYRSGFYVSNKEIVLEFKESIKAAFKQFREKSSIAKKIDGLYAVEVTAADLTLNEEVSQ